MKKVLFVVLILVALVVQTLGLGFLNSRWHFLPGKMGERLDCLYEAVFHRKDTDTAGETTPAAENISGVESTTAPVENDMVRFSSLVTAPALKKLDLWLPNHAYIPSSEEVEGLYTLSEGAVIAAYINEDLSYTNVIVNDYDGVIVESLDTVKTVRDQVAAQLQAADPTLIMESENSIEIGSRTIPVITMMTAEFEELEEFEAYSCIAFVSANDQLVTVTIHHYGDCDTAFEIFDTTLSNLIVP